MMKNFIKLENIKTEEPDESSWNEEITIKEENIKLEMDPLAILDEDRQVLQSRRISFLSNISFFWCFIQQKSKQLKFGPMLNQTL